MGHFWSKRRPHHHHDHEQQPEHNNPPPPPTSPPPSSAPPPRPLPLPLPTPPQQPPSYAFAANAPYPSPPQNPYPIAPPPPPPPSLPPPQPRNSYNDYSYNNGNYSSYTQRPVISQTNFYPYFIPPPPTNLWLGFRPTNPPFPRPGPPPALVPAVPYVDHQSAKKIKNDVNVKKESIRLDVDEINTDCHLVCFTFDAMVEGSITILYFAKEGANCTYTPVYPEIVPVKIPFQKGLGQKFCQPSGSGIDLGFFDVDDLSKASPEDVFPLVIVAESTSPSVSMAENNGQSVDTSTHAQITLAVLEKKNGSFKVKVIKQILWVDGVRYELREIFGISSPDETAISDQDTGKECVICMTEPKDTTVLPCRHMCLCSGCAKELRLQTNKCPMCRQPIEELLEIKVGED